MVCGDSCDVSERISRMLCFVDDGEPSKRSYAVKYIIVSLLAIYFFAGVFERGERGAICYQALCSDPHLDSLA